MSEAKSVQFQKMPDVIQAYENWDIPGFAIWHKNQFQYRYCGLDGETATVEEGKEVLTQWLKMLYNNNTAAIYTLCVYEDIEKGEKIVSDTPYSGSFNFRLHDSTQGYLPPEVYREYGGSGHKMFEELQQVKQELKMIKEKAAEGNDDGEEDTPKKRIGDALIGSLESILPVIGNAIGTKVGDWLNPPAKTATISGITLDDADTEKWTKVHAPLNMLMTNDPDFPAVLEQLSKLQQKNGFQYNIYKGMLLRMKF